MILRLAGGSGKEEQERHSWCAATTTPPVRVRLGRPSRPSRKTQVKRHYVIRRARQKKISRRVDPLAERQGALAAHAAGVVRPSVRLEAGPARSTRLLLASTPYRTPPTRVHRQLALLAVCRCILVLEDQLACSTSKRPIVLPFIALRPVSAPPSERVGVWSRDNSGLVALLQRIRALPPHPSNGACQHLPSGSVSTF